MRRLCVSLASLGALIGATPTAATATEWPVVARATKANPRPFGYSGNGHVIASPGISVSRDGRRLVYQGGGKIAVTDTERGTTRRFSGGSSADGLIVRDLKSGRTTEFPKLGFLGWNSMITADGRFALAFTVRTPRYKNRGVILDLRTGTWKRLPGSRIGWNSYGGVAISGNGHWIAEFDTPGGEPDTRWFIVNLQSRRKEDLKWAFPQIPPSLTDDGRYALFDDALYDRSTGRLNENVFLSGVQGFRTALGPEDSHGFRSISADGRFVPFTCRPSWGDGGPETVVVRDLVTGRFLQAGAITDVTELFITPDGTRLLARTGTAIRSFAMSGAVDIGTTPPEICGQ